MTASAVGYRFMPEAVEDLRAIFRYTTRVFGRQQATRYRDYILAACRTVAATPNPVGSKNLGAISPGLAMYPVRLVTGRTKGASPVLIYTMEDDEEGVIIVRILHERMDPANVLS